MRGANKEALINMIGFWGVCVCLSIYIYIYIYIHTHLHTLLLSNTNDQLQISSTVPADIADRRPEAASILFRGFSDVVLRLLPSLRLTKTMALIVAMTAMMALLLIPMVVSVRVYAEP